MVSIAPFRISPSRTLNHDSNLCVTDHLALICILILQSSQKMCDSGFSIEFQSPTESLIAYVVALYYQEAHSISSNQLSLDSAFILKYVRPFYPK